MRRAWVPALCAVLQVVTVATGDTSAPAPVAAGLFVLVGVGSGAVLLAVDRYPVATFALCAVGYPLQALLHAPPIPAAMTVMSYRLARRSSPGTSEPAGVLRAVGLVTAGVVVGAAGLAASGQLPWAAPYALLVVASASVGLLVSQREIREETVRRELLDSQRLQIARELHDVVGHSAGAIGVQAGAARVALSAGAVADASSALTDIEAASHELLREVRWMVGLLRDSTETPGLADLDRLVDHARRSGLDVRVHSAGDLAALPRPVSHEAYRILQEALTNVLRHSPSSEVEVSVDVSDGLLLRVSNPLPAGDAPALTGAGIRGMQERAADLDGRVRVGPDEAGGWLVEAALPLRATR